MLFSIILYNLPTIFNQKVQYIYNVIQPTLQRIQIRSSSLFTFHFAYLKCYNSLGKCFEGGGPVLK